MSVLQLRSTEFIGGAETVVLELSKELASKGYANTIGILHDPQKSDAEFAELASRNKLPVQLFKCRGRIDLQTVGAIRHFIAQHEIALVHAHGYKARFYALLSCRDKPRITTCHLWDNYGWRQGLYIRLDKFWLTHFDKVVAVSVAIRDEILRAGVPSEKVTVIDNGIDMSRFNGHLNRDLIRDDLNIPPGKVVVGSVGRLVAQKGFDIFLRAARRVSLQHPNLLFVIVGDGPLMNELRHQAEQLRMEYPVIFLGQRDDIPELLAAFDIFVMSSLDEGLPMVLLEAMASQKPIIATRVGAIPTVVEDHESALLIEPDADELCEKISELVVDKETATRLGIAAHRRISQYFSSQAMTEKYVQLYEHLLN